MKLAELKLLKVGDELKHKRYGLCKIKDISNPDFGVVIHINNPEGRALLHTDCGADIDDLMETSPRSLSK